MNTKYKAKMIFAIFLSILLASCNLPSDGKGLRPSDVQTAAALTVQALLTPSNTVTVQPALLSDTLTPTFAPTGTITPTYSVPMLRVLEQTNCRTGPGQEYEVLYTYLQWKELEIIGNYPQENYWLVKSDQSSSGSCWLWGGYVEVSGSYWAVPSVTPPPTATIPPPQAPSIEWEYFCSYANDQIEIQLTWADAATNETGYRIIRNGQAIVELPANSTLYNETIALIAGDTTIYQVEVYNTTGSTRSSPVSFKC